MPKEIIYESTIPERSITTDHGHLFFRPSQEDQSNGKPYGVCNISIKQTQVVLNMTEDQLRELIVAHKDYTEDPNLVGKFGIWPQYLRKKLKQKAERVIAHNDTFERLSDSALIAVLKEQGIKPPKNADHKTLVEMCVKAVSVDEEDAALPDGVPPAAASPGAASTPGVVAG